MYGAILSALGAMTGTLVVKILSIVTIGVLAFSPLGKDLFGWVFYKIADLAVVFLSGVTGDAFGSVTMQNLIDQLDGTTKILLYRVGIPEAMGIVISAVIAKTILRIIPFGRLGN